MGKENMKRQHPEDISKKEYLQLLWMDQRFLNDTISAAVVIWL
jgi:hypothetical protein